MIQAALSFFVSQNGLDEFIFIDAEIFLFSSFPYYILVALDSYLRDEHQYCYHYTNTNTSLTMNKAGSTHVGELRGAV
jgi:hypothetical protein